MTRAIYYSKKTNKYYVSETNAFGEFCARIVYGCNRLTPADIEIKTAKNGKHYFLGDVAEVQSEKTGNWYLTLVKPIIGEVSVEVE